MLAVMPKVGLNTLLHHVVVQPVQRHRNFSASLEIQDAGQFPDNRDAAVEKTGLIFIVVRQNGFPGQFHRLNRRIIQQDDQLHPIGGHDLRLLVSVGCRSDHGDLIRLLERLEGAGLGLEFL